MNACHAAPPARARPPLRVEFEPRFCSTQVVDLTAGCSFGCLYCPFSDLAARRAGVSRPTAVDLTALDHTPPPASVFLSPASDAFAPQAAPHTHTLLARWLPRGTLVGVVTKGIIPPHTLDLLAAYRNQIEGVAVGLSSLDDDRNAVLEPGCPPAAERLANIDRLAERRVPVGLRMDPLFPCLDDTPAQLGALVGAAARRGASAITATYVFVWGRYLRRLRAEPLLAESCRALTERTPMEGGTAFSVPLARKTETYTWLARLAGSHGLRFNTCGCKDLRLRGNGMFDAGCRNTSFLAERGALLPTHSGGCPAPAPAALVPPPDGRRA